MDALTQKTIKICLDIGALKLVVSKASGRLLLTTHSDRINTYYTAHIYVYAGLYSHTDIQIRIQRNFVYIRVYTVHMYTVVHIRTVCIQ